MYSLSLDIGTSKIGLLAFDLSNLGVVSLVSAPNTTGIKSIDPLNGEQDPEKIWEITQHLFVQLKQSGVDFTSVASLALTGQMHGILLIDAKGKPHSNLITWRDARYGVEKDADTHFVTNGCHLQQGYGGTSLVGLKKTGFDFTDLRVCTIASFIVGKLCGNYGIDDTSAASLGLYNLEASDWNHEQIEELGLPLSLFPRIGQACTVAGTIRAPVALFLGLPKETVICFPIGDNQASYLGAVGFSNTCLINIGTGGQLSRSSTVIMCKDSIETRPLPGGKFLQVYSSLCGGWAYAYLKDFCKDLLAIFGHETDDDVIYATLDALALAEEGKSGLCVDTRFMGLRGEENTVFGSIKGINTKNFRIGSLAYGFLEGMVGELQQSRLADDRLAYIVASGNAVRKNALMRGIIEKQFNCPCILPPFGEEAAVGAAIGCAVYGVGNLSKIDIQSRIFSQDI